MSRMYKIYTDGRYRGEINANALASARKLGREKYPSAESVVAEEGGSLDDPIIILERTPIDIPFGHQPCSECNRTGGIAWEDRNGEQFFDKCLECDGKGYVK